MEGVYMNPEIVGHVRQSWAKVAPIAPLAAALFYNNLFALEPGLKSLFKGDMEIQGGKLVQMIDVAISKLDALDELVPALQGLGARHAAYGVEDEHYTMVGEALLSTLAQGLGDEFTAPVREAWTRVYEVMATVMMDAGNGVA